MNAPAEAPVQNLIDGVDVDAVAQAARACPGVEDLYGGFPGEVATYLPGRRLVGVRVGSRAVEVQVRAAWDTPVRQIAAGIRSAVAPLAGGRAVDVTIADLGDPPGTAQTSVTREPGTSVPTTAKHGWPTADGVEHAPATPARSEPARADPPKAEGM